MVETIECPHCHQSHAVKVGFSDGYLWTSSVTTDPSNNDCMCNVYICPQCGRVSLLDAPNQKGETMCETRCETRCETIPRLKWHERLLCWLLFRIEAKNGFGVGGFTKLDMEAMRWFVNDDHVIHCTVCSLMRDYVYARMAHEREKERRNG